MLEEISQLLGRIGTAGSFATRRTAPVDNLHLEVKEVGRIRLPITAATARKLCTVARSARYGFKDQTRLDTGVRDTWEIPKSRISIDQRRWKKTLAPALDRIRRDLGLPEACRLKAELHSLLVYAPGQFFLPHQDSEKTDNMIGTLVVSLPSQFAGGAIVIEHHDAKVRVGGSDKQLTFIAFYADCRHEVRPIKQGHRVVLTYNLIAEGNAVAAGTPADRVDALIRRVRDYFETSSPPRWSGDRRREPSDRLVYLLDHQYTQRGLAWDRLKNADAARAAALQEVARRLDCEIFLALADVHETWTCEDEDHGYGGHRWGWQYEDDEDESRSESSEPELTELVDSDVELRHWIEAGGSRPEAIAGRVGAGELCYTKPSVDCEPFESEHQGYMGNSGNTVDRWYHRAAVVLWPRERTFVIRAKASPRWAVGEIAKTLKAGNAPQALAHARRLQPFWLDAAAREERPGLLDKTLQIAAKLDDADVATALLAPFTLTGVTPKIVPRLVDLLERYGLAWCHILLRQWTSEKNHYETPEARLMWLGSTLPAFCRPLCAGDASDGQALVRWLLADRWAWMLEHVKQLRRHADARDLTKALSRVCEPMLAVIESSRIANQPDLNGQVMDFLTTDAADLPLQVPLGLLRAAHRDHRPDALRRLGLRSLHAHCVLALTTALAAPARALDDWSIQTPLRCSCELCATLTRFLRSVDNARLEWPLVTEQRRHVHGIIDSHDLPLCHTTRRTGRPYTLTLEKTAAVFERDAAERRLWKSELEWLKKTASSFSSAVPGARR